MVNTLRSRIRKAAIQNPELRPSLVPLLKQGRGNQDELGWAASEIEGAAEAADLIVKLSKLPAKLRRIR